MGKLNTTKLESSWEAHIQDKRILIGPETPFLGPLGGFKRFSLCMKLHTPQNK